MREESDFDLSPSEFS